MRITFPRKAIAASIRASLSKAEATTLKNVKKMAKDTLEYAARVSPQWTGTFAANWRLSIDRPRPGNSADTVARKIDRVIPIYEEGDQWAINKATGSSGAALSGLHLGQAIYLSTRATNSDGDEYHWDVEAGRIRFRKDNPTARANKGRILELAKAHLRAQYAGKIR